MNKRLQKCVRIIAGHGIHELKCLFHVNEVYLTHAITAVEGKKKGPGAMQDGAILNKIKNIEKPNIDDLDPNQSFQVSVTKMASIQVTAKLNWFSQQKEKAFQVAVCEVMFYEQESTCHSRWVTTANRYLRMLIFNLGNFSSDQQHKLKKIISYIISVYVPSFIMIHLNPQAAQGPSLTLFQRDLILAYRQLEPDIADVV